jgi:levansucrase
MHLAQRRALHRLLPIIAVLLLGLLTAGLPASAVQDRDLGNRPPDTQQSRLVPEEKQTYGVSAATVKAAKTYSPRDNFTATWKYADALKVRPDATTTTPIIPLDFPVMTNEVWIWDTWPLTGLDMKPLSYRGWSVIFSLVAPRDIPFGDRHWQARIGFFYSRDGQNWTYGGHVFPDGSSRGSREWAGTAILTGQNTVNAFYTASGRDGGGIDPNDPLQRLAMSKGTIHADNSRVWFTGFDQHRIIAEPDGNWYQTLEQSEGSPIIYAFRDPYVFRDPKDHKVYALFEGNTGGDVGTYQCTARDLGTLPPETTVHPDANLYTGNIGLMEATTRNLTQWRLLPPVLSSNCVNQQVERPHVVIKDGTYHLFTISHQFTYAPGLTGPDGLYGFVGPALRSDYKPLNASALVLGNPPEAPKQNYSHEVMPNLLVQSFIDTIPLAGGGEKFGGTLAPTLRLDIDGANTYLAEVLPYGYIPAMVNKN